MDFPNYYLTQKVSDLHTREATRRAELCHELEAVSYTHLRAHET